MAANEVRLNEELPLYEVTAHNYAEESSNKIHSDEVAREYGFRGGLVPGVAVYAYMMHPIIASLGHVWLRGGWMRAKLVNPAYHGEKTRVQGKVCGVRPLEIKLEALDPSGKTCGTGSAGMTGTIEPPVGSEYPRCRMPEMDSRAEPRASALKQGRTLGSIEVQLDTKVPENSFFADLAANQDIFSGPPALHHPAFLLHLANMMVVGNVAVGPWIHTESEIQHFAPALREKKLEMRGKIASAFEKRGHEYLVLDIGVFDEADRAIAHVMHKAIVRPRAAVAHQ